MGPLLMPPKLKFELDGEGLPVRLDLFIRHEVPDLSRSEVQRLIRSGAGDGESSDCGHALDKGGFG